MTKPVILVFDARAGGPRTAFVTPAGELAERYGRDYAIEVTSSAGATIERLRALVGAGVPLALTLADLGAGGASVLTEARALHPLSRRALLLEWDESRARREELVAIFARGQADWFVNRPAASPDERFHRSVTELLEEWWRATGTPVEVVRVVGDVAAPRTMEVCDLLQRHDYPYTLLASDSVAGAEVLASAADGRRGALVVQLRDGRALVDPTTLEVAEALGARTRPGSGVYDLVIVGGGPAGLAAAVSAASEGLRTALVEPTAMGGQAGTSSLIRNYLGFPRGISGAELATRAFEQAIFFGTEMVYGSRAVSLEVEDDLRLVGLSRGGRIPTRTVIVATGVSYRMLDVPDLERFDGAGVHYGAGMAQARAHAGQRVYVVGGGNSAGQAALHFARFASNVTLVVRSASLAQSMSEYLIRDIATTSNIDVRFHAEVVGAGGAGHLERLSLRDRRSGVVEDVEAAGVFILIGAAPFTDWLPPAVVRDQWGYIVTGPDPGAPSPGTDAGGAATGDGSIAFETTLAGVFAVGDVRQGSVKRVASAAGEGAMCVRLVHQHLDGLRSGSEREGVGTPVLGTSVTGDRR